MELLEKKELCISEEMKTENDFFDVSDPLVGEEESMECKIDFSEAVYLDSVNSEYVEREKVRSERKTVRQETEITAEGRENSADGETKKKRAKRRFWEHPSIATRNVSGRFQSLYQELRQRPEKFFNFYGMSVSTFDELLDAIKGEISKRDTVARMAITAEERLTVTLRYLVVGAAFSSLAKDFLIGRSTMSGIVKETCGAIWKVLQPTEMAQPTREQWTQISENFYRKTSFPNCVGVVDCKHVRIVSSQAALMKKAKKYNSVLLMAVADANYKFTAIEVSLYGSDSEEFSFKGCGFGAAMLAGKLRLPPSRALPGTTDTMLPHLFVADEDFPLHENLMKPFPSRDLSDEGAIFNYRLARAQSCIECAYGILCHKWRLLASGLTVAPDSAMVIVKAVCVLHNFVGERDGFNMEDSFLCYLDDYQLFRSGSSNQGKNVRQALTDYFSTPAGEVSWQYHGLEKS